MTGVLIYFKLDFIKNNEYAKWIVAEGKKIDLNIDIILAEDFFVHGLKKNYDFAINRSRNHNISLILELNNIQVFNSSNLTLIGNNKLLSYAYAKKHNYDFGEIYFNFENRNNYITKPIDGHGGNNISISSDNFSKENYICQNYITNILGDVRFYIINNEINCAIIRKNENSFIHNFSQGGTCSQYFYSETEKNYVLNFISDLSIDYAGIDFFLLKNGTLIFNEIEDVVGSRMLSKLKINNTTNLFLSHIKNKVSAI